MKCNPEDKSTTYGSNAYCTTCGMDLDVSPVIIRKKGIAKLFCCEECAR